jgi:hypothetical protein
VLGSSIGAGHPGVVQAERFQKLASERGGEGGAGGGFDDDSPITRAGGAASIGVTAGAPPVPGQVFVSHHPTRRIDAETSIAVIAPKMQVSSDAFANLASKD